MNPLFSFPKKLNSFLVERIDQTFSDKMLSQRLRRGALWSAFGAVISRTLAIAASILVARLVGKNDFGGIGIIQSTIVMLSSFAGFGAGIMATRFVAQYCRHHPQKAGSIIFLADSVTFVLSLVISLLFFFFSGPIAAGALAAPALAPLLKISAILLFFNTLIGTQLGILTGFEAFRKIARINLGIGIASMILLPLGAFMYGISGAIWAMTSVAVINWILNLFTLRGIYRQNNIRYKFEFRKEEAGLLWTFNFPSFLSSLTFTSAGWICNTMLVNATGYGEMGVINACNSWYTAILFFPTIVSGIILPVMSERLGINETG
ncbi:MAG: oligosaccharide flippase family protein, partial [bacterium]